MIFQIKRDDRYNYMSNDNKLIIVNKNQKPIDFNRTLSLAECSMDGQDCDYYLIVINHLSGIKKIKGYYTLDVLYSDKKQWI